MSSSCSKLGYWPSARNTAVDGLNHARPLALVAVYSFPVCVQNILMVCPHGLGLEYMGWLMVNHGKNLAPIAYVCKGSKKYEPGEIFFHMFFMNQMKLALSWMLDNDLPLDEILTKLVWNC